MCTTPVHQRENLWLQSLSIKTMLVKRWFADVPLSLYLTQCVVWGLSLFLLECIWGNRAMMEMSHKSTTCTNETIYACSFKSIIDGQIKCVRKTRYKFPFHVCLQLSYRWHYHACTPPLCGSGPIALQMSSNDPPGWHRSFSAQVCRT